MVPFMPGRRTVDKERAFFAIFSTMMAAIAIARLLPDPGDTRESAGERERFSLAQLRISVIRQESAATKQILVTHFSNLPIRSGPASCFQASYGSATTFTESATEITHGQCA
jgi:hypothetical protein